MKTKLFSILGSCLLALAGLMADVVETRDGARLTGTVIRIEDGTIHLRTTYAGDIQINQSDVVSLTTDNPVFVRLQSGEVVAGPVSSPAAGQVQVQTEGGDRSASLSQVTTSWRPSDKDPAQVLLEKEMEALRRKWEFRVGVDITGRDGNTRKMTNALRFNAQLEGPSDRLRFYGSYLYGKERSVRTEDELILGVNYTNFFSERWGWYVRTEFEMDEFEDIDFRSTSGAGLTYRFIKRDRMTLEGNAGLSYRYEDYNTPGVDSNGEAGLDLGLLFGWQFADWGRLNSSLTYTPTFGDFFGDYMIKHDSGIEMPLGASDFWVLRIGMANDYNAQPQADRKKLDTTYYLRLILTWE
jgi:putative salt-induced outer membrane protein YdiY